MTEFRSTDLAIQNLERTYQERITQIIEPPPNITLVEWADENRWLLSGGTAFPGRWDTSFTPYMKEIMEAISDPFIRKVTLMCSVQTGKTELILNMLGYYIHLDPCSIMIVYPTGDSARKFAKTKVNNLFIDNPFLQELIADNEEMQFKQFPGGTLDITTARSPSELASKAVRVLLLDEVDRMDPSAGGEGDPVDLAIKRCVSFFDCKVVLVSTPGDKSNSRIEPSFLDADQRKYHVPCPHCGEFQELLWANLKCDKDEDEHRIASTAYFECLHCQERIEESSKKEMAAAGEWIALDVGSDPSEISFGMNAFVSPMPGAVWSKAVREHQQAHNMRDMEKLKQWTNTVLAETWEDVGERVDPDTLMARIETYEAEVPDGVKVLICSSDTAKDFIDVAIWGIGKGYEKWLIHTEKIILDPINNPQAWIALKEIAERKFTNAAGQQFQSRILAIDHGYSLTKPKLEHFVKNYRGPLTVIAVKGMGRPADHYLQRPKKSKHGEFHPYIVRTDPVKEMLFHSYEIDEPGPGYLHLPDVHNIDKIISELTGEEKRTKMVQGVPTPFWKKTRRNEQLDMLCYAIAALQLFGSGFVAKIIGADTGKLSEATVQVAVETPIPEEKRPHSLLKEHLKRRMPQTRRKNQWAGWEIG